MNWQEIVEFLGGAAVFGIVIAYLGQKAIEAYLSGRLEEYKGALQRETTEHSIRFQSLHAERAETIKTLYARLVVANDVLGSTLARFQSGTDMPLPEKVSSLAHALNELRDYYLPRKIFLELNRPGFPRHL